MLEFADLFQAYIKDPCMPKLRQFLETKRNHRPAKREVIPPIKQGETMERSEQINELAAALAKAQAKFTSVNKGRTVRVKTKAGFEYSYKYAELADILDMIRIPMTENGLSIVQTATTQDSKLIINTMLLHSTGQFIKSDLILPVVDNGNNAIQAIGGSITYGRRYSLCSLLGISSEEDTDAQGAAKAEKNPKDIKPSTQKPPVTPMPSKGTRAGGFSS